MKWVLPSPLFSPSPTLSFSLHPSLPFYLRSRPLIVAMGSGEHLSSPSGSQPLMKVFFQDRYRCTGSLCNCLTNFHFTVCSSCCWISYMLYTCVDVESLKEENRRLKDTMKCKICMDKDISTLFLPCSHLVCCDDCAPTLRDCPICRTPVRGTVRTYISWTRRITLYIVDSLDCKWMSVHIMLLFIAPRVLCC